MADFGLRDLGKPGSSLSRGTFVSTAQLSFPASEVAKIRDFEGVDSAVGGLPLNSIHIEGTVPEQAPQRGGFRGPGAGPPDNIDVSSLNVSDRK